MKGRKRPFWSDESGSLTVEYALAFMLFWSALMGVIEFSRLMLSWGVASEATRLASRLASLCDKSAAQEAAIRNRVAGFIAASGQIDVGTRTDWLKLTYYPNNCTVENCTFVEARLSGLYPTLSIPGLTGTVTLPDFRIRTPREAMRNTIKGENNDVCT